MNLAPSGNYEKFGQKELREGLAFAWISRDARDTHWDKFLSEIPLGQFQQSTIWARAKAAEGWNPVRCIFTVDDKIVAGFQILWRSSWHGRMGYVSKGPVISPGYPGLADFTAELLRRLTRSEKLRGLMVQPPDLCKQMPERLPGYAFQPDMLAKVNSSTWVIDTGKGFGEVERQISRWTRKKIKEAINQGVTIREGQRADVSTFFELMLSTCQRQKAQPVPADLETMLALWDAAEPEGGIRLTLAESQGRPLAALVCIIFGHTVSFWKKGWTSSDRDKHPNELLMHEMLQWACSNGYQTCDFCAFDRDMAIAILERMPLTEEHKRSRHVFNVRLGGSPWLLPKAQVYFPNPVIRLAYRAALGMNVLMTLVRFRTLAGMPEIRGGKHARNRRQL